MSAPSRARLSLCLLLSLLLQNIVAALPASAGDSIRRAEVMSEVTPVAPAAPAEARPKSEAAAFGELPLSFEENRGQAAAPVKFLSRGYGYNLSLSPDETVLSLCDQTPARTRPAGGAGVCQSVKMKLAGSRRAPLVEGLEQLPGTANYFVGADPAKWLADVPTFGKVRYRNVYAGIDVEYYGNQRQLEYDFILAPAAAPRDIRLAFEGARRLRIDASGDLLIGVAGGEIRQRKPYLYQVKDGVRHEVRGGYVRRGNREIGFEVGAYDRRLELVIDPVLVYSTYLGDGRDDRATGIAIDEAGSAYVVGNSETLNAPATREVFVMKLNDTGTALDYTAHLGGAGEDTANAIAVDSDGNASVVGETDSPDFPVSPNAFQSSPGSTFVARLNGAGNAVTYSTYFGGDTARAVAADAAGHLYIAGAAGALSLRTTAGAFQPEAGDANSQDAFVAKLDPSLSGAATLVYATFLGGSGNDSAAGVAVDAAGNAHVAGRSESANFPVKNQLVTGQPNGADAFLSKLSPTGGALLYSTLLAGEGADYAVGVALDATGKAYVAGVTHSDAFPISAGAVQPKRDLDTCGAPDGSTVNCPDAFMTKLDTAKTGDAALLYSTYVGGAKEEYASAIAVDANGYAYVTGATSSPNFPIANSTQDHLVVEDCGGGDAFLTKLNPARTGIDSLLFSTYLGGECHDAATGVAVDAAGNAFLSGHTLSAEFPILGPAQAAAGGNNDAFVAKLDTNPNVGCQYTFSPASKSLTSSGGTGTSTLTTPGTCEWTLASSVSWVTITSAIDGAGNASVTYTVAPNINAANRSGNITLTGLGGVTRTISITQSGCYTITPTARSVGPNATTGTVAVSAGTACGAWSAVSNASWITITSGGGGATGNGTVAYSVAAHSGLAPRTGTLTIAGKTFTVTQSGCYSISPTTRSIGPNAATGTVSVTAGTACGAWSAASNASWITITSGGGSGNGTVAYSVAAHSGLAPRSGTLTIAGKTFTVTQSGCYSISPVTRTIGPAATTGSVAVSAGTACGAWSAVSNASWMTITSGGGSGNGTVNFSVAANTGTSSRSGTLTIAGKTHTVTQLGCYSISPSGRSAGPNGLTGTVAVSASTSCGSWTAASDAAWLAVTSGGGGTLGNGTVGYAVEATTSAASRTGHIRIADKTFTVTQAACSTISPSSRNVSADPSTGTINVTFGSGCSPWGAVSNVPWIVVVSTGSGAAGSSTVTYSVKVNPNARPRTGTLTVGSHTFTVTQAADPTPQRFLQFSAPAYQFNEDAVGATVTVTRTGDVTTPVTVGFATTDDPAAVPCATANGTAYARCDYATTIDTISFAADETQKQITIPVIDDAHVEGPEVLQIKLVNPTAATLGAQFTAAVTIKDNDPSAGAPNPINGNAFFVRLQYLDFLSREPEAGEPWTGVLNRCPNVLNDPACDRILVSSAFFGSPEFQLKGYYTFLFYRVAFGRLPEYAEIVADMRGVSGSGAQEVYDKRAAFAASFAARPEFKALYDQMSDAQYVEALLGRHGLQQITTEDPAAPEGAGEVTLSRQQLTNGLAAGTLTRAKVLRAAVQSREADAAEYHGAFVAMQYYGYLRRTPEQSGYDAWLRVIRQDPTNVRAMIDGFMNSVEYRLRFGRS